MSNTTVSSVGPPKILTRSRAWTCVAMNQLAFPGLGTIMAGRRIGYVQAVLMVIGFLLLTGFMTWFIVGMMGELVGSGQDHERLVVQHRAYAWTWQFGLGLSLLAWFWALASSAGILRQVAKGPPAFRVT